MAFVQTWVGEDTFTAYWHALVADDEQGAFRIAARMLADGVPHRRVLEDLVGAAQVRVGRLWAGNEWTVAQEQSVSAVTEGVIRRLDALVPPPLGSTLVVACAEQESHTLAARLLTTIMRAGGHPAHYVDTSAPGSDLTAQLETRRPRALLLSASLTSSLLTMRRQVVACRALGIPVIVGGRAFDAGGERARRLGASGHAASPDELESVLRRLPARADPTPPLDHPGAEEAEVVRTEAHDIAGDVLRVTARRIGLDGDAAVVGPDDWRSVLTTSVPYVVGYLAASLLVEDPTIMRESRVWLSRVLLLREGDVRAVDELWGALALRLGDLPRAVEALSA